MYKQKTFLFYWLPLDTLCVFRDEKTFIGNEIESERERQGEYPEWKKRQDDS